MENSEGLYDSDHSKQFSDDDDGGFSLRNAAVDKLGSDLRRSLKIEKYDDKETNIYCKEDEEEDEDEDIAEGSLDQMGYGKTKTKNRPAKPPWEEGESQMGYRKTESPKHKPPTTPISAENLKTAMKGSSKKEESPDKERKVTWAEDVYDPIPSAPSHIATNRIEWHRSENKKSMKNRKRWGGKGAGGGAAEGGAKGGKDKDKGGKDKEKKHGGGKGGRGAKGGRDKDKKQVKKYSGSSTKKWFDTPDEDDT